MAEKEQCFDDFTQWVNKASSWLTRHPEYNSDFRAICYDSRGRHCTCGRDFARARDEGAFPVSWLWPDQVGFLVVSHVRQSEEFGRLADTLLRFRDYVSANGRWSGGEHHNPIWAEVADMIAKAKEPTP